jgi:4-hydroxyphenylpyruvate dioxygenase
LFNIVGVDWLEWLLLCKMCRPTIFLEIIQRVGCMFKDEEGKEYQKGGCGGFGKGNFSELFKSVEEYEKTLEGRRTA